MVAISPVVSGVSGWDHVIIRNARDRAKGFVVEAVRCGVQGAKGIPFERRKRMSFEGLLRPLG